MLARPATGVSTFPPLKASKGCDVHVDSLLGTTPAWTIEDLAVSGSCLVGPAFGGAQAFSGDGSSCFS